MYAYNFKDTHTRTNEKSRKVTTIFRYDQIICKKNAKKNVFVLFVCQNVTILCQKQIICNVKKFFGCRICYFFESLLPIWRRAMV